MKRKGIILAVIAIVFTLFTSCERKQEDIPGAMDGPEVILVNNCDNTVLLSLHRDMDYIGSASAAPHSSSRVKFGRLDKYGGFFAVEATVTMWDPEAAINRTLYNKIIELYLYGRYTFTVEADYHVSYTPR